MPKEEHVTVLTYSGGSCVSSEMEIDFASIDTVTDLKHSDFRICGTPGLWKISATPTAKNGWRDLGCGINAAFTTVAGRC